MEEVVFRAGETRSAEIKRRSDAPDVKLVGWVVQILDVIHQPRPRILRGKVEGERSSGIKRE